LQQLANGKLRTLSRILDELNLKINASKTSIILHPSTYDAYMPEVVLNEENIPINDHARVLGIQFQGNEKFKKHFEVMVAKIDTRCNAIKRLTATKHGGHPESLMNIFRAVVRSVVEYGSTIYGDWLKGQDNKVQQKMNAILKLINGLPHTTPANVTAAIASEPPINIRRDFNVKKQTIKEYVTSSPSHEIWKAGSHDVATKHLNATTKCFRQEKNFIESIEKTCLNEYQNQDFDINVHLHEIIGKKEDSPDALMKQLSLEFLSSTTHNKITIYTDASKKDNECAFGVFCPSSGHEERIKLVNYASICTAEMLAIGNALEYIRNNSLTNTIILSDSLASCQALLTQAKSTYITETTREIFKLMESTKTSLVWIPSHIGISGNERADSLAKEALHSGREWQNKIRQVDANSLLKSEMLEKHQKAYQESEK
jgi:ribonuclease HI